MTREEAIELIESARKTMYLPKSKEYISDFGYALEMAIKALEQEPKTGHWIHRKMDNECWEECSECHVERAYPTLYCPDCGVKMVEPQERSDKNDKRKSN